MAVSKESPERVDVLIVGAGISGVDAACRLKQRCQARLVGQPRPERETRDSRLDPTAVPLSPTLIRPACNIRFMTGRYLRGSDWRGSMDLNYLFYRQQVERSRANSANSEVTRKLHEKLAIEYERQIARAAGSGFDSRVDGTDVTSDCNPTMAVAITAREVRRG
jgi:hypothetical protein